MKSKCSHTTEHRAAKVDPNNHLRNWLFAGRGRWRPAVLNPFWSVGQSFDLLTYRGSNRESGPLARNYVGTQLRDRSYSAYPQSGGEAEMKLKGAHTTGRRGTKVVTSICLKGFLSARCSARRHTARRFQNRPTPQRSRRPRPLWRRSQQPGWRSRSTRGFARRGTSSVPRPIPHAASPCHTAPAAVALPHSPAGALCGRATPRLLQDALHQTRGKASPALGCDRERACLLASHDRRWAKREEVRLGSRASPDWRYALRSKKLASLSSRLIERHIPDETLLEVVDRRNGLIQRHLRCHVDWLRTLFWIGHF
jgi:hypothetical protein